MYLFTKKLFCVQNVDFCCSFTYNLIKQYYMSSGMTLVFEIKINADYSLPMNSSWNLVKNKKPACYVLKR